MFFSKAPLPLSLKKKKNKIRVENSRDALNNKTENRLNLSAYRDVLSDYVCSLSL